MVHGIKSLRRIKHQYGKGGIRIVKLRENIIKHCDKGCLLAASSDTLERKDSIGPIITLIPVQIWFLQ